MVAISVYFKTHALIEYHYENISKHISASSIILFSSAIGKMLDIGIHI
jgi:hypothetical protein